MYELSPYDETLVIDGDYFIMNDVLDQVWGSENDFMINCQYRDVAGRHGGNISYIDDKIGDIIDVLERTLQVDNTIILFLSDHGDMLGDSGLWFKMSFFEGSARVPLMMAWPNIKPGSYTDPVSTLDVTPTLAELAGISLDDVMPWTDGISLVPGFSGTRRSEPVLMEYAAEGSNAPLVCIRDGRWKYVHCELDP